MRQYLQDLSRRFNAPQKQYMRAFNGQKFPIDIENPLVMIKCKSFGKNYQRGSFVFPIGEDGNPPGYHSSEGWMTISSLNDGLANFCGVRVGKTALPLRDLLQFSGTPLGISYDGKRFTRNAITILKETAIDEMLNHYTTEQLPAKVRDLRELSRVISSELTQYEDGIVFEKLEHVAAALIMYAGGFTQSSTATHDRLLEDMQRSYLEAGVNDITIVKTGPRLRVQDPQVIDLKRLRDCVKKGSLVEKLIVEVMKSSGNYSQSFDYDAMGSAFFKTSVNVQKIDDKYVLSLNATYVGEKPEIELAQVLERERGLISVSSRHQLTPTTQDWISIDVDMALRNGRLTSEQINALTRISAEELSSNEGFVIEMDKMPIHLSLGIRQEENYQADVLRAKGNQLWMKTNGERKSYFSLTLTHAKKDRIVAPEEKRKMMNLRDELSELVKKNLAYR